MPISPISNSHLNIETKEMLTKRDDYWENILTNIRPLSFPFSKSNRKCSTKQRNITKIDFDHQTKLNLMKILSSIDENISSFDISLSIYLLYLFKLTQEKEIIIGIFLDNDGQISITKTGQKYLFPFTFQIDPQLTFLHLIKQIKQACRDICAYIHIHHKDIVQYSSTLMKEFSQAIFVHQNTKQPQLDEYVHDFICIFTQDDDEKDCYSWILDISEDLFDEDLTNRLSQRFKQLLDELFLENQFDQNKEICSFSLVLPDEQIFLNNLNIANQEILDQRSSFPIWQQFVFQCEKHPQKLSIILEDQSISYAEILHNSQSIANYLIDHKQVKHGDIILISMQKTIQMVIGIMGILISGASYCPFPIEESSVRLDDRIETVRSKYVLIDHTRKINRYDGILLHQILFNENFNQLNSFDLNYSNQSLAMILFTSGSTGKAKGVCLTHSNLVSHFISAEYEQIMISSDTILQRTPVTLDMHAQDILGGLWLGASIILLRPDDDKNIDYIIQTIKHQQISYMFTVPTIFQEIVDQILDEQIFDTIRVFYSGGEALQRTLAMKLVKLLPKNGLLLNGSGPAECTLISTYCRFHPDHFSNSIISIGRPLPGYECFVLDQYHQMVFPGQIGELYIKGIGGGFLGYINDDHLTKSLLISIDNQGIYFASGDLVRINSLNENIDYLGRKDFQIKLRGIRIECDDIEQTILSYPFISIQRVLVIKYQYDYDEYLLAYLQTSNQENQSKLSEKLRHYCVELLPKSMIPSFFIHLDKFPLNSNGKIDRKSLPKFDLSQLNLSHNEIIYPKSKVEIILLNLWKDVLHLDHISTSSDFFSLAGNSLLLMKLIHSYKIHFNLNNSFSFTPFLNHPNIIDHGRLIEEYLQNQLTISQNEIKFENINQGPASFAQIRLYTDERIRFSSSSKISIYNTPSIMFVKHGQISFHRLQQALNNLIEKQSILRTKIYFNMKSNELQQSIHPFTNDCYQLIQSQINTENELNSLIKDEQENRNHFNYSQGKVFRCHLICKDKNQYVIFNFHHIIIDEESLDIFFNDLRNAYEYPDKSLSSLRFNYIHFAQYEKNLCSKKNLLFWKNLFDQTTSTKFLHTIPFDRIRLDSSRTGDGYTISFEINQNLSFKILQLCLQFKVTLNHLMLTFYFIFIFKLTQENDIQIGFGCTNRYHFPYFNQLIGLFVNILPFRYQINPNETFKLFLNQIKNLSLSLLEHSHISYEQILKETSASIPRLMHQCIQSSVYFQPIHLNSDIIFQRIEEKHYYLFDLNSIIYYSSINQTIQCYIDGSKDLFDQNTLEILAKRYELFIEQIILFPQKCLYLYSIHLPYEITLYHSLKTSTKNYFSYSLIDQQILHNTTKNFQKISLQLEDQSITYAEFLYFTTQFTYELKTKFHIQPNDVICQLVQRSFEMIIGILGILSLGGIYCPLSSEDSYDRILFKLNETKSKCLIIHNQTLKYQLSSNIFNSTEILLQINEKNLFNEEYCLLSRNSHSLAALLYTSGSTGYPKGVLLTHENFLENLRGQHDEKMFLKTDIILQQTPITFDVHLADIFGGLLFNGSIQLIPAHLHRDIYYLLNTIIKYQVSFVFAVPTLLTEIFKYPQIFQNCKTLRIVLTGGESFSSKNALEILNNFPSKCSLVCGYGPAECTFCTTLHYVTRTDIERNAILPIGQLLSGYQCLLLDQYFQNVIPGQKGELFIGGRSVFSGYLNRLDLTEKVLIEINGKDKYYRTGDFIRYDSKTNLFYFIGRKDFQIKFRAQRIECEEIEQILLSCPLLSLSQAIVIKSTNSNGDESLIAFIQIFEQINQISFEKILRTYCEEKLPLYMIPSKFILLKEFPLNSNGKVNREMLLKMNLNEKFYENILHPQTDCEQFILSLWKDLLKLNKIISIDENFFTLGGNSLLLIKVIRIYEKKYNLKSNIEEFYRNATICHHASIIDRYVYQKCFNKNQNSSLIKNDEILDENIFPLNNNSHSKHIFLTGSNGFLGNNLLNELIKQTSDETIIFCLLHQQRNINQKSSRIIYLHGDLSKSELGLSNNDYQLLIKNICSIYHCASIVNILMSYEQLRLVNVQGTIEIIKLACLCNAQLNYISSIVVEDIYDKTGYAQSKRISESLIQQAKQRGLNAFIFRSGYISWCTETGYFNVNDWFSHLFLGLIKYGSIPDSNRIFELIPVNYISKLIVQTAENSLKDQNIFIYRGRYYITFKNIWEEIARQLSLPLKYMNLKEWKQNIEKEDMNMLQYFHDELLDTNISSKEKNFSPRNNSIDEDNSSLNLSLFVHELLQRLF